VIPAQEERKEGGRDLPILYMEKVLKSLREEEPPSFLPRTLYIGGGTPSRLSEELLSKMMNTIRLHYREPFLEITIEVNPEDLSLPLLRVLRKEGITRLSIGVQRFSPAELKLLGRKRTYRPLNELVPLMEFWKRMEGSVSLDILYGIPGETEKTLKDTILTAVRLPVDHLSLYALTVEEGTPYEKVKRKRLLPLPSEDSLGEFYEMTLSLCEENGFYPYEVSNFAKEGAISLHNLQYWAGYPYIGYGLSATSTLVYENPLWEGKRIRFTRHRSLTHFLNDPSGKEEIEELSGSATLLERLFLGLRSVVGIPVDLWEEVRKKVGGPSLPTWLRKDVLQKSPLFKNSLVLPPSLWIQADGIALFLYEKLTDRKEPLQPIQESLNPLPG
jgi:oxygen-independent coproporphyrinogen-3 oxidase